MSGAENIDPNQAISFAITKFPNSLIIPSDENLFSFRITNNQSDLGTLKFSIAGENLKIAIPEEFESEIKLQPSESKNYDLKIEPVVDGFGKLIINAYWMKIVKVVVKVQKLRDKVAKSKLKEIFKSYSESKTKTGDIFNAKSFIESISEKDLLIFQQQFEQKKNKYKSFQLLKQSQINQAAPPLSEPIQEISLKEIEKDLKKLAKGFLYNKNLTRALQLSLELSDESDKLEFYRNLIRAYATIDLNGTLQDVMGISDNSLKQAIITQIATDRVAIDAEQASRVAMLIEDIAVKEKLILNIVRITIEQNPALALKLSYLLEESMLKVEIMFNIAKKIHEQNNREELISIINQIITLLLNYKKNNFEENNYKNNACEGLVNAICVLAEIDSPKSAEAVIENLSSQQLKEKVALELFNILYVMVDEVKEKLEPTLLFSQYYLFNTLISNVNDTIKDFSLIGGNVSNNILLSDFNFNVILLSLFNYDFSVFPVIDRVYADLRYNYQKFDLADDYLLQW